MVTPVKASLEALIFASPEPLTVEQMKKLLRVGEEEIFSALQELKEEYDNRRGGFILEESAGGYWFRTREEHKHLLRELLQVTPPRLSRAQMELLAIIAYRQPISRAEIEAIRGVDSSATLRTLVEAGFVAVVGEKEAPGKPRLYGTTSYFLRFFGLNTLADLPPLPPEWQRAGFMMPPTQNVEGKENPSLFALNHEGYKKEEG